jgi:hypothetical protein
MKSTPASAYARTVASEMPDASSWPARHEPTALRLLRRHVVEQIRSTPGSSAHDAGGLRPRPIGRPLRSAATAGAMPPAMRRWFSRRGSRRQAEAVVCPPQRTA